jgi:hypothetical protein
MIFSTPIGGYLRNDGRWNQSWKKIGTALQTTSMTCGNGKIYGTSSGSSRLWMRPANEANESWQDIGHTNGTIAMGFENGYLYGINSANKLWYRKAVAYEITWTYLCEANNITAMAIMNGVIYGYASNKLYIREISTHNAGWIYKGTVTENVLSMTSSNDKIYFSTIGKLYACSADDYGINWKQVGISSYAKCMGMQSNKIYAQDGNDGLWVTTNLNTENINVTSYAIKDINNNTVILLSADLLSIDYSFVNEIKTQINAKFGIPSNNILFNVTHTHYAPLTAVYKSWSDRWLPEKAYLDYLKIQTIKAIEQSILQEKPSKLYFARGNVNIGENRSSNNSDGTPYDQSLDVIKITDMTNKTTGIIFFHGCHPVFVEEGTNNAISPNFPGIASSKIETQFGTPCVATFFQACGADINPKNYDYVETGLTLASAVINHAISTEITPISGIIACKLLSKKLKLDENVNTEAYVNSYSADEEWNLAKNNFYAQPSLPHEVSCYIQEIGFGNTWKLTGLSGEVVTEYGESIRAANKDYFNNVTVVGYCNDVSYYLPKDWHITDTTYEGYTSGLLYGLWHPFPIGTFSEVLGTITRQLVNFPN